MELVSLFIGLTFVNNVVLSKFYAVCPLLGVSKKPKNALNMGYAVTFVIFVASIVTYASLSWCIGTIRYYLFRFNYIYLGYCFFSPIC